MLDTLNYIRWPLALLAIVISTSNTPAAPPQIPPLPWQERSDWINVKTDVEPRAVGDGQADDTAAIQKAFGAVRDGTVLYFPPGTYRLTQPISVKNPSGARWIGGLVIGHGRDSTFVWDGGAGGRADVRAQRRRVPTFQRLRLHVRRL